MHCPSLPEETILATLIAFPPLGYGMSAKPPPLAFTHILCLSFPATLGLPWSRSSAPNPTPTNPRMKSKGNAFIICVNVPPRFLFGFFWKSILSLPSDNLSATAWNLLEFINCSIFYVRFYTLQHVMLIPTGWSYSFSMIANRNKSF